ncbi:hypothetical protein [Escherichia coli]|nr:hypothetical protein [Escherichia coli]EHX07390.1 efa1/LifA-like domain protein [Escherichia coli DEC11D]
MAAWAIGNDNERKYGFYDANGGVVEFSETEKFKEYMTELFSASGLNKAEKYHLKKLPPHNSPVFDQIVLLDGEKLSQYKTNYNDDAIKNILDIKVFDSVSKKESVSQPIKKTSFLKNIILKIVFFLIIEWTQLSPKNTVRFLFLVRMPL